MTEMTTIASVHIFLKCIIFFNIGRYESFEIGRSETLDFHGGDNSDYVILG
jgi:hypothetical protein